MAQITIDENNTNVHLPNQKCGVIYWDYQNVTFSDQTLPLFLADLGKLVEELKTTIGPVHKKEVIGSWNLISQNIQTVLFEQGYNMTQVPQVKKNAVDNQLMVKVLDEFHSHNFHYFVLIAGDGDYFALCDQLRQKGVQIIILAREVNLSEDIRKLNPLIFLINENGYLLHEKHFSIDQQIETIQTALLDGDVVFEQCRKNLAQPLPYPGNITLDYYSNWLNVYRNLQTYHIKPGFLRQILTFEEFFKIYCISRQIEHTVDFNVFSLFPLPAEDNLELIKTAIHAIIKLDSFKYTREYLWPREPSHADGLAKNYIKQPPIEPQIPEPMIPKKSSAKKTTPKKKTTAKPTKAKKTTAKKTSAKKTTPKKKSGSNVEVLQERILSIMHETLGEFRSTAKRNDQGEYYLTQLGQVFLSRIKQQMPEVKNPIKTAQLKSTGKILGLTAKKYKLSIELKHDMFTWE